VLPRLRAAGTGLTIHHKGRRDVPPLISIRRFTVTGSVLGLLRGHATRMTIEGLDIQIPPDRKFDRDRKEEPQAISSFVIDELVSVDARLAILPREAGRRGKVWNIHHLRMLSVGNESMPFEATLTNAIPPGEIQTRGNFGPWDAEDPGQTPLDGSFLFEQADLSVFKGISGTLSAQGSFDGALGRIDVQGETNTPDFTVTIGGQPVPLHTRYRATVDGTNGDTILDQIDGSFLDTSLRARGRVTQTPGVEGRTVQLDVTMDEARIEDVLRLAVKAERPMVGALTLETELALPPGDRDVVDKLQLDGRFTLTDATFTNVDVRMKIAELSQRSRGRKPDGRSARVSSDFNGTFKLANGRLRIPAVSFDVPGAAVRLAGTYDLRGEELDFRGTLFTDVKVSEMTSGIKSLLLKMLDPLFGRDGGGSAIPIRVAGTRNDPSFGLDKQRVFSSDAKAPEPALR